MKIIGIVVLLRLIDSLNDVLDGVEPDKAFGLFGLPLGVVVHFPD